MSEMPRLFYAGEDRSGWYFQQFVKWAVRLESETDDYVVVDADTIFLAPTTLRLGDKYVFYRTNQWHKPYFDTFEKLLRFRPERDASYIANFMIFNRQLLDELIRSIQKNEGNEIWHRRILAAIDPKELSSFSEYETYGYYLNHFHPNCFRSVKGKSLESSVSKINLSLTNTWKLRLKGYNSVSYHNYSRNSQTITNRGHN
jgi:hypothetical protein